LLPLYSALLAPRPEATAFSLSLSSEISLLEREAGDHRLDGLRPRRIDGVAAAARPLARRGGLREAAPRDRRAGDRRRGRGRVLRAAPRWGGCPGEARLLVPRWIPRVGCRENKGEKNE